MCYLDVAISVPAGPARSGWGRPAVHAAGARANPPGCRVHAGCARCRSAAAAPGPGCGWRVRSRCRAPTTVRVRRGRCPVPAPATCWHNPRCGWRWRRRRLPAAGAGAGRAAAQDRLGAPATRFLEHGHAHHADVVRAAGAAGVAAAGAAEHELRHFILALAPAGDVRALAGVEHVAGLRGIGIFAGNGVDAVHRQHHQHPPRTVVVQAHGVARATLAGPPALAFGGVAAQFGAAVAGHQGHAHRAALVGRRRGQGRAEAGQGQDQQAGAAGVSSGVSSGVA